MELLDKVKALIAGPAPVVAHFEAPDKGDFVTPYACTFHWFRGPDGRTLMIDAIRSDDRGELALRAGRERPEGGFDWLCHTAPRDQWAGFVTDDNFTNIDATPTDRPILARHRGYVAGSCA